MPSVKGISVLAIALIAALIMSSSTFTVAYAQQMQIPRPDLPTKHLKHALALGVIAIALLYIPSKFGPSGGTLFGDCPPACPFGQTALHPSGAGGGVIAPNPSHIPPITPPDTHGLIGHK